MYDQKFSESRLTHLVCHNNLPFFNNIIYISEFYKNTHSEIIQAQTCRCKVTRICNSKCSWWLKNIVWITKYIVIIFTNIQVYLKGLTLWIFFKKLKILYNCGNNEIGRYFVNSVYFILMKIGWIITSLILLWNLSFKENVKYISLSGLMIGAIVCWIRYTKTFMRIIPSKHFF